MKCSKCSTILFSKDFDKNLRVCTKCGHHSRLTSSQRILFTVDEGSFEEFGTELRSTDPLGFPEYPAKLEASVSKFGHGESFRTGYTKIGGSSCVVGVAEFGFRGGTLGSVAGEKITRALEAGAESQLPVILFTASGGARMEEGLIGLMQMAKTSAAVGRLGKSGMPLIVVLTDPTTGGVLASYASLGDIILAEPGAQIAFAGARVAAQAQTQKLPANYQTAEWRLEQGQIDMVVARRDLPGVLGRMVSMLGTKPKPAKRRLSTNGNGHSSGNGSAGRENETGPVSRTSSTDNRN